MVLTNSWVNHATQFNWALGQLTTDTDWVLRLDADEIVSHSLATEFREELFPLSPKIHGVYVSRYMTFLGRRVQRGGLFPTRLFRYVLRLGFLDGKKGTAFHVLQGFWYRYLVDMKLYEVKVFMKGHNVDATTAIQEVLGINVRPD